MTVDIVSRTVQDSARRSPLGTYAGQLAAVPKGVTIREVPFLTQLDLRVEPGSDAAAAAERVLGVALPTTACTAVSGVDGAEVLWLGPDEWLVVAPAGQDALEGDLRTAVGQQGAVVDVSAQRTTIAISGPRTAELLAHGCSIDLDPRVSPKGTCVQTLLALAGVVLVVRDEHASDVWVLVRSSFARYLADWLLDACAEYEDDPSWR